MNRTESLRVDARNCALGSVLGAVLTVLAIIGAIAARQAEDGFLLAGAALGTAAALSWTIYLADQARHHSRLYYDEVLRGTRERQEVGL